MNREQFILEQIGEIDAAAEELQHFSNRPRVKQIAVNIGMFTARIKWAMREDTGHFEETDAGEQMELLELPAFLRERK